MLIRIGKPSLCYFAVTHYGFILLNETHFNDRTKATCHLSSLSHDFFWRRTVHKEVSVMTT